VYHVILIASAFKEIHRNRSAEISRTNFDPRWRSQSSSACVLFESPSRRTWTKQDLHANAAWQECTKICFGCGKYIEMMKQLLSVEEESGGQI